MIKVKEEASNHNSNIKLNSNTNNSSINKQHKRIHNTNNLHKTLLLLCNSLHLINMDRNSSLLKLQLEIQTLSLIGDTLSKQQVCITKAKIWISKEQIFKAKVIQLEIQTHNLTSSKTLLLNLIFLAIQMLNKPKIIKTRIEVTRMFCLREKITEADNRLATTSTTCLRIK